MHALLADAAAALTQLMTAALTVGTFVEGIALWILATQS